ncbi:MAG: hypothetical protein U0V87_05385 [Acidobacteriota bacterium]
MELPTRYKLSALLSLALLAAMVAAGLTLGTWSWPGFATLVDPRAWLRALFVVAILAVTLPLLARPQIPAWQSPTLIAVLTLFFFFVRFDAPIGDWQVIAWSAEVWQPPGKWYGAALFYGLFHQLLGSPNDWSAATSVALCSSLLGALQTWIAARMAMHLDLARRFPAWRWLYIGAFGLVAMGLGHREIYPLVSLLTAWVAYRVVLLGQGPEWTRAAHLGLALAAGVSAYVGGLLLIPAWSIALGWWIWRGHAGLAQRRGALWLAGLPIVIPALLMALGPTAQNSAMAPTWASQVGGGGAMNDKAFPPFLPPDVHWDWFTNFIAPKYWFSAWHLRDLFGVVTTSQSLVLVFVALALIPAWRCARREHRIRLILISALALPQLGYAALVVPGIPYPWDWDLPAHALGALTWMAMACCAALLGSEATQATRRSPWPALAAIATCLLGAALLRSTCIPPATFGASNGSLSLAVGPTSLVGTERQFVWLWLRNDSTREITLSGAEYSVALVGERNTQHVRSRLDRHTLIGSRRLRPGEQSPLTSFYWDPGRFEAVELREDPQGSRWKPIDVSQLTGRYKARWLLSIPQPSTDTSIQLSSAAIDWIPPGQ